MAVALISAVTWKKMLLALKPLHTHTPQNCVTNRPGNHGQLLPTGFFYSAFV